MNSYGVNAHGVNPYGTGPWPGEDGGPGRLQHAPAGRGLALAVSGHLRVTSRLAPAATMAVTAATATQANLGTDLCVPWPCERECHPPCPLLRSCIPDPFRHHNVLRYDDVGHRTTRVSFRDER